ncbi:hypothetical protein N657DRAFT_577959 [Parathielavia appendiculata]|uniref:Uncharacterized protein n=1 Tax=Parathielavia appendiculata TaxID=2587402 RepID=A0AAN6Z1A2_9PEZI|nr:hypothetical protein N657DRAFT_577959 [Parathielavia appendiculata]
MFVKHLLPAFVAIGSVAAQSTCTVEESTTTVNSQADATKLASCDVVDGSVVIGTDTGARIDISGPKEITGSLEVLDNGVLETLTSSDLEKIGGAFTMRNVTLLTALDFSKLTQVQSLNWQSLNRIATLRLGPISQAEEVTISDTFLDKLDGIDLESVRKLDINNNMRLQKFTTQLKDLSDSLNIQANGIGLNVSFPNLVWIANMTIANVTDFSVPSLEVVNGSARFDSNYFESFSAPNLTHTESGDISFVGNGELKNMTFPKLTTIGGGLLIANNTGLDKVDFFPELQTVGGAVKLRGNFTEVDFPALEDVKGAFDVSSTADIQSSCDNLLKKAPQNQGGDGKIQGTFSCTGLNENANEDTDSEPTGDGDVTGSNGGDDKGSGAAGVTFNAALFGLVGIAVLASAL